MKPRAVSWFLSRRKHGTWVPVRAYRRGRSDDAGLPVTHDFPGMTLRHGTSHADIPEEHGHRHRFLLLGNRKDVTPRPNNRVRRLVVAVDGVRAREKLVLAKGVGWRSAHALRAHVGSGPGTVADSGSWRFIMTRTRLSGTDRILSGRQMVRAVLQPTSRRHADVSGWTAVVPRARKHEAVLVHETQRRHLVGMGKSADSSTEQIDRRVSERNPTGGLTMSHHSPGISRGFTEERRWAAGARMSPIRARASSGQADEIAYPQYPGTSIGC